MNWMLIFVFLLLQGFGQARVIVVSIDGLRPDAVTTLGAEVLPHFYRLREEGAFTDNARTDVNFTETLPNHTSMITSRPVLGDCGHGLQVNFGGVSTSVHVGGYHAGMFDVAHDHGLSTALFGAKGKFAAFDGSYNEINGAPDLVGEDNGRDKLDVFHLEFDDSLGVAAYIEGMKANLWDLSMLHIRLPDSAGHQFDWNLDLGSDYLESIITVDGFLGQIFQMLDETTALAGATHLIVTTDHGGTRGTRTHINPLVATNYTIPFYVWGPGVIGGGDLYAMNPDLTDPGSQQPSFDAVSVPIRSSAVGNLALSLLNLPPIPGSCINVSQQLRVSELPSFGTLYPELDPAGDINGNGQSNFFDYANGADPREASQANLMPQMTSEGLLAIFRTNTSDVVPEYEISGNLTQWSPLAEGVTMVPISAEEIPEGRRVLFKVPSLIETAFYRQIFRP